MLYRLLTRGVSRVAKPVQKRQHLIRSPNVYAELQEADLSDGSINAIEMDAAVVDVENLRRREILPRCPQALEQCCDQALFVRMRFNLAVIEEFAKRQHIEDLIDGLRIVPGSAGDDQIPFAETVEQAVHSWEEGHADAVLILDRIGAHPAEWERKTRDIPVVPQREVEIQDDKPNAPLLLLAAWCGVGRMH
jgi:hypothetical protein